jgi:hypothetical protein
MNAGAYICIVAPALMDQVMNVQAICNCVSKERAWFLENEHKRSHHVHTWSTLAQQSGSSFDTTRVGQQESDSAKDAAIRRCGGRCRK